MDWLHKLGRRYVAVLAPVVAVGPAVLCLGWCGSWHDYTPSAVLPDVFANLTLEPADDGVQRVFVEAACAPTPAMFDYPFPGLPIRNVFASRSGPFTGSLDWRLFRDELAHHEIELKSGPDEMVNVEIAAKAIDGTVVRPFEIFSFNSTVGERSVERGFRPGLMFSNGEVVMGLGGGVCIVSTGLYNAVCKAGCKILDRAHHSGPVRYAEPGLDSAVVYGALDLSFKNDSISPIMIRCRVEGDKLVVSLRGRKRPGLEVEIVREGYTETPYKVIETEGPAVPEGTIKVEVPARAGYEVTIVRVFKQDGKVVEREVLSHDVMPARDKVVLIPPKPKDEAPAVDDVDGAKVVEAATEQTPEPDQPVSTAPIAPKPTDRPAHRITIQLDEAPQQPSSPAIPEPAVPAESTTLQPTPTPQ